MRKSHPSNLFLPVHVLIVACVLWHFIPSADAVGDVDGTSDGKPGPASIAARRAEAQADGLEQQASNANIPPDKALVMKDKARSLRAMAAAIRECTIRRRAEPNLEKFSGNTPATSLISEQRDMLAAAIKSYDANGDGIVDEEEQAQIDSSISSQLRRAGIWTLLTAQPERANRPGQVGFETYYAMVRQSAALTKQAMVRPLTAREQFDLSLSLFGTGRFAEASMAAQLGMGQAKNDTERAAFFGVIAQSRGALGNYAEAARAALEGHRLSPLSKELAAMRVVYSIKTGNGAQVAAAEDALAGLEESGERVFLGPLVRFLWQNRKAVVAVLTTLGPPIMDQLNERWPQHKATIEAGIQTLKMMWTITEQVESTPSAAR